jgi:hypothetical protein
MQARLRSFAIRLEIDDSTMNSITEMLDKIQVGFASSLFPSLFALGAVFLPRSASLRRG